VARRGRIPRRGARRIRDRAGRAAMATRFPARDAGLTAVAARRPAAAVSAGSMARARAAAWLARQAAGSAGPSGRIFIA